MILLTVSVKANVDGLPLVATGVVKVYHTSSLLPLLAHGAAVAEGDAPNVLTAVVEQTPLGVTVSEIALPQSSFVGTAYGARTHKLNVAALLALVVNTRR